MGGSPVPNNDFYLIMLVLNLHTRNELCMNIDMFATIETYTANVLDMHAFGFNLIRPYTRSETN